MSTTVYRFLDLFKSALGSAWPIPSFSASFLSDMENILSAFAYFLQVEVNSAGMQNLHHSDKILKKCKEELRNKLLSTYSNCCLVLSVLLTWHLPLASRHHCVLLPVLPSFLSPSADLMLFFLLSLFFFLSVSSSFPLFFFLFFFYPSHFSSFPLLISSTIQTMCLTGVPITVPRVHHRSISQ